MSSLAGKQAAVVAEARAWVGTPYRHQAALKGVGCDCAGLVRGVGAAAGGLAMTPAQWAPFATYGRRPGPRLLARWLAEFFVARPGGIPQDGDVIALAWRDDLPMHLAIAARHAGRPTLIHALADTGRVVEHGMVAEWGERVAGVWRFPGLVD